MSRRRSRRHRALAGLVTTGELRLTSMMDILTVLLLFLLKSFVVGGEDVIPPPGLELPKSTAQAPPPAALIVAIDDDAIMLSGERVATVHETVAQEGLLITSLDDRLQAVIAQRDEISRLQGSNLLEDEVVTIQGDREVEFRVLRKVLFTLHENGFQNVALAVVRTPEGT